MIINVNFCYSERHLLVNAKDRRVVICESILCPSAFRDTLAKVLFKHFEVYLQIYTLLPNYI